MARPKSKSPEELQKNARKRRERFVQKRSDSGLREIKVYLDLETLQALDMLCKEMGYSDSNERKSENRGEVLANVVGYCIRKTAGCTKEKLPETTLKPQVAQSIFRIKQVLKYRRDVEGEENSVIARFMNKYEYPKLTSLVPKSGPQRPASPWSAKDVEYALDPKNYRRLLAPKKTTTKPDPE